MEILDILALTLDEAKKIVKDNNYEIKSLSYINEPPGTERIVRVKVLEEKYLDILVAYHNEK